MRLCCVVYCDISANSLLVLSYDLFVCILYLADITAWELPCDKRGEVGGNEVDKESRSRR